MDECPPKPGSVTVVVRPPGRAPFRAVSLEDLTAVIRIYRERRMVTREEMKLRRLQAMGVVGHHMQANVEMFDRVVAAGYGVAKAREAAEAAQMGALNEQIADLQEMAEDLAEFANAGPTTGASSGTKSPAVTAPAAKPSAGSEALAALQAAVPNPTNWEGAYEGTHPKDDR